MARPRTKTPLIHFKCGKPMVEVVRGPQNARQRNVRCRACYFERAALTPEHMTAIEYQATRKADGWGAGYV